MRSRARQVRVSVGRRRWKVRHVQADRARFSLPPSLLEGCAHLVCWQGMQRTCQHCDAAAAVRPPCHLPTSAGKDLWSHVLQCRDPTCTRTHCSKSRDLISHFSRCTTQCPICWPVREFITRTSVFPHAGPPDTHIAATAGAAAGPAAALFAAATAGSRAAAAAAAANAAAGAGTVHGDGDDDEQLLRLDSPTSSITSTGNWCPP
jgi:hypothetical protein